MIKELNRISKLGYECEIIWNKNIHIYFDFSNYDGMEYHEPVSVLTCLYDSEFTDQTFQKYIVECCNEFYSWYTKNNKHIEQYIENNSDDKIRLKIDSLSLGDVSTKISRTLNIDDILDY